MESTLGPEVNKNDYYIWSLKKTKKKLSITQRFFRTLLFPAMILLLVFFHFTFFFEPQHA